MMVLDRRNTCMFILTFKSRLYSKRIKEAVEKLSSIYPEGISEDSLLFVSNGKNCFLVYVFKDIPEERTFIIPELYVKNHSKVRNGNVLLNGDDYSLAVTLKDGFVTESVVVDGISGNDASNNNGDYQEVIGSFNGVSRRDRGRIYSRVDRKRDSVRFIICIIALFAAVISAFRLYNAGQISELRRIQAISESERKKQEELLRKQKESENLKEQYEKLIRDKPIKVKDALSVISGCLEDGCTVRSMAVDGFIFSLEITCADVLKVYDNFEKEISVENIVLSRLGYENNKQVGSFSGVFSRMAGSPDLQGMSADEKISYYENLIAGFESRKILLSPSEYSLNVKTHLEKAGCNLLTLSRRENSESSALEVSFTGTATSLVSFLDGIQGGENAVDISSFRLRNSDGFLSCTAVFEMPASSDVVKERGNSTVSDERISNVFLNGNQGSPVVVSNPAKVPSYSYVGRGKSGGVTFILIKNDTDGRIVRLILSESSEEDGTCSESERGYKVNYEGQIFEVRL